MLRRFRSAWRVPAYSLRHLARDSILAVDTGLVCGRAQDITNVECGWHNVRA